MIEKYPACFGKLKEVLKQERERYIEGVQVDSPCHYCEFLKECVIKQVNRESGELGV